MKTERTSLSNNEKVDLVGNLSTLLSAGIPILEAVESLLEDSKGNLKKILQTLRNDLMEGKHVYASFSKFPRAFDKVTVNLLKAAEEAGALDVTLKDLKDIIRKEMEFTDKVKSALTYPILIIIVFAGVLLMILTFVVPKISTVFMRLKVDLPLPTKIMIVASNFLLQYTLHAIVAAVILFVGCLMLYRTQKKLFINLISSLPLISNLINLIDLTRFSRSLFLLLNAGIPITSALELTQEVVAKKSIEKAIIHAKEAVLSGKKLSEGFKGSKKIIPGIFIKITEAGEKTGSLDKSMQDISEYLDYQVTGTLKTVTTLLEPIMLVFVGVLVGAMMLAIIAPIYGLISQVGAR